jgi:hypothetical protein
MGARRIAFWTAVVAGLVSAGVIIHEWRYRTGHRHALGPSGELIALGLVGLLLSIAVLSLTSATEQEGAGTTRWLRNESDLHVETRRALRALEEAVLDGRVLQYMLINETDTAAFYKWQGLITQVRDKRKLDEVPPHKRRELELQLADARLQEPDRFTDLLIDLSELESGRADPGPE